MKPLHTLVLIAMAWATAGAAEDRSYRFLWQGGGGYTMTGAFSYDPSQIEGAYVRARDLSCFAIEGQKDGVPVGRFALTMLTSQTTWTFHFHPASGRLPVDGDDHGITMPQAWNMDGVGRNCGMEGFGFNAGNYAQDLCVDNQLITESQQPPQTPFVAFADRVDFPADACRVPPLLSRARPRIAPVAVRFAN